MTVEQSESASPRPRRTGLRESLSLLRRNPDFRNLYFAQIISFGGDWFLWVAIAGLVLDLTGSPITLALSVIAQEIPFFFFSPIGGVLADRLDRRKLMVSADLTRAVLCLGFFAVGTLGRLWIAFALLGVISALSAIFDPASSAAVPNLVDEEDLAAANSLVGSAWGTMLAVGAAIGGIVVATFGRDVAFVVDGLSFVASAALLWRIDRPLSQKRPEEHPRMIEAAREALVYARRDRRVMALLSVKAGFGITAGGVIVLIAVFARQVFKAGDVGVGLLMGARGVGALIGPFIGRWIAGRDDKRLYAAIAMALVTFAVCYGLLGIAPSILVAAPLVMFAHFGGGAQWALSSYGLQKIVPDHIRGRIFSVDFALITATFATSSMIAGIVAAHAGPRVAVAALSCSAVMWAGVWWLLTRKVRREPI